MKYIRSTTCYLTDDTTFQTIFRNQVWHDQTLLSSYYCELIGPSSVIAFLATNFFSTAGLRPSSPAQAQNDSYKLAIGWAAVNSIASVWAYFLIENKEEPRDKNTDGGSEADNNDEDDDHKEKPAFDQHGNHLDDSDSAMRDELSDRVEPYLPSEKAKKASVASTHVTFKGYHDEIEDDTFKERASIDSLPEQCPEDEFRASRNGSAASSVHSAHSDYNDETYERGTNGDQELLDHGEKIQLRGRRFLLLTSLSGGAVSLLVTSLCFLIPPDSPARLPMIAIFIMVFTVFYSIGAGAVAFLYCAEVFPNEGRGMFCFRSKISSEENFISTLLHPQTSCKCLLTHLSRNWDVLVHVLELLWYLSTT